MEFNELILSRRSVRSYKAGESISDEELTELFKAVQQAPSWKNSQTGRYYVARSAESLDKVRSECLPPFNGRNSENAVALIVSTFVKGEAGFGPEGPTNECADEWGAYDLGLQGAYLCLKARDMGYDTLIMGIRDGEKLREVFGIPETEEVMAVLALGKRDTEPKLRPCKELSDVVKCF